MSLIISIENTSSSSLNRSRSLNAESIPYSVIAKYTLQQYVHGNEVQFDLLLSIPDEEKISAFTKEYGLKKVHHLVQSLLVEFCASMPLPKSKRLSGTKLNFCTCDLLLAAHEDALSMEDLVIFFERAKTGEYGSFNKMLTHYDVMEKFDVYRQQRMSVYNEINKEKIAAIKSMGNITRIGEAKSVGDILQSAQVISMNKRMSG